MNDTQQNRRILESRPFFDQTFPHVELALGVLSVANTLRSSWIDIAETMPSPDIAKIKLWNSEREQFTHQTFKVYGQDKETLDYVLNMLSDENEEHLRKLIKQRFSGKVYEIISDN